MPPKILPTLALLSLIVARPAFAADPAPAGGSTVPSDPVFSALLTDGSTATGRIRQLGPNGTLTLAVEGGADRPFPLDKVVKLSREAAPSALAMEGPAGSRRVGSMVVLPDGDRLRGTINASDETTLDVQSFALGALKIPINRPLGLILTAPPDDEAFDALAMRVREEPRNSEVLWLANGDRMAGGFLGLGQKTLAFQPETGKVELDLAGVVALGFEPALASYPKPKGTYLEVTLSDGSRLGLADAKVERGRLLASARVGVPINVSMADISKIVVRGESVAYLSDRADAVAAYEQYVGPSRPYRRDTTVDGHPMRLAGQPFEHGLGTQSRTLLAYKLRPGDRRFQATVGLDDRAGPLGSAVFKVLVNKKEAFVSPPMASRGTPRAIDVDVEGATSLILITEFGERGEVRDLADWAEARIVR